MLKLLYIGFDGLDPDLLPAIDGFEIVRSFSPVPITGPAWTSLNTGLSVENHGLSESWGRAKPGSKTFMDMRDIFFWDYLNDAGLKCGVMNVPITWPPKVIDGWMVSGPFVPNRENITFPPDLFDPVAENYFPDLLNEFFETPDLCRRWFKQDSFDPFIDEPENMSDYNQMGMLRDIGYFNAFTMALQQSVFRVKTLVHLTNQFPVDCVFYQDSFLDRLNHAHAYQPGSLQTKELYRKVVELVDIITEYYPAETTIIVSDHGGHSGHHTDHGVFAIKNNKIRGTMKSCHITDVLPTTLYAMDIFVPIQEKKLDGRVCYHLFNNTEDSQIDQQLRGLGYIK